VLARRQGCLLRAGAAAVQRHAPTMTYAATAACEGSAFGSQRLWPYAFRKLGAALPGLNTFVQQSLPLSTWMGAAAALMVVLALSGALFMVSNNKRKAAAKDPKQATLPWARSK